MNKNKTISFAPTLVGGNPSHTSSGANAGYVPYSSSEFSSGGTPKNKSPSRSITNFFSRSFSQTHQQGIMSRTTPPASPTTPQHNTAQSSPFEFGASVNLPASTEQSVKAVESQPALYASHQVKYIGSTVLRRRHTLPMLNWIVTELLYQSKCDGEELHVRIRNCKKSDEAFKHLRAQLTKETHLHGLSVKLEMRQIQRTPATTKPATPSPTSNKEVAFQVSNLIDGQMLLNHSFRRVFLFGKFSRESSLFYYLHKDQDDRNAVPTLYVFQANNDAQLSEICVKYNELRPTLNAPDDKHLFLNSFIGKTGVTSNCFEVLHVGSVVVSQKRATPSMIDRAAEEFGKLNLENNNNNKSHSSNLDEQAATLPPPSSSPPPPPPSQPTNQVTNGKLSSPGIVNGARRQYKTKRFLVEVIDENEPLESTSTTITTPTYHTSSPSTIPQNSSTVSASDSTASPNSSIANSLLSSNHPSSIFPSATTTLPTTLISNTQSLDCDTRKLLLKEFQQQQNNNKSKAELKYGNSTTTSENEAILSADDDSSVKVHVKNIDFSVRNGNVDDGDEEEINNQLRVPDLGDAKRRITQQQTNGNGLSALKRSSSGETTLINDSIMLRQMQIENFFNRKNGQSQNGNGNLTRKNKTMLFIIGQMDICLISTENHKTVLSKTFSNISHCSQGVNHADHFGIIVREPFSPNSYSESYVCHIFKCQTQPIVNELLGSLKQAFNNAYRASKIKQQQNDSGGSAPASANTAATNVGSEEIVYNEGAKRSEPYCANCPMNWFHQLCLDIDGLDNSTIFVLLMFRIEQHSSHEKLQEFYLILDLLSLDQTGQKVDVLMILLKARAERMQRRHEIDGCQLNSMTIYDQIDDNQSDSRSTSSLTRLEGLKLMAKNSLSNTFESLRKINKNFQSSENLQKSNSGYFLGSNSSIGGSSSGGGVDGRPSQSYMDNRRNTLAECFTESMPLQQVFVRPSDSIVSVTTKQKSSSEQQPEKQQLLESGSNKPVAVKPTLTKLSSLEELSRNLGKLELDPTDGPRYLNPTANTGESEQHFSKNSPSPSSAASLSSIVPATSNMPTPVSSSTSTSFAPSASSVARHRSERQLSLNSYHQIRYKLFARIQRTINDRDSSFSKRSSRWQTNTRRNNSISSSSNKINRKRTPRELWKYAIQEHILMIKMCKQQQLQKKNEVKKTILPINRVRFDYDEIPNIGSREKRRELISSWDKIIATFDTAELCGLKPKIESTLVQFGIPRNRKRDVWLFVASFYKQCRPLAQDTSDVDIETYRNLLEQLSTQQHAIFVDLGRTFPNVPFYGETMGSGQLSLFNILKAYSLYDKEVEYCQGLSFLAGILLLHMSEDEAFKLMCFMLYNCGLRDQYKPDMDALKMQMYQLCRLLFEHNQPLHDHLERHQVKPDLYAAPCFLTVFAAKFPISFVARVFDFLIYYGIEVLFRIFIALLDRISSEMLECNDFESIMQLMKNRLSSFENPAEMEVLFLKIAELDFVSKLEQYKTEYKTMQAEQSITNKPALIEQNNNSRSIASETPNNKTSVNFGIQIIESNNPNNLSDKIDELLEENCNLKKVINQLHSDLDKERDNNRTLNSQHSIQIKQLQSQIQGFEQQQ